MTYDVDYFIRKFEAIPEEKWCTDSTGFNGRKCAIGHLIHGQCGAVHPFRELMGPIFLSAKYKNVEAINDGLDARYQQPTPKQRILAALHDIKKMQSKEPEVKASVASKDDSSTEAKPIKEKIRYVSVSETIKEERKELILN